MQLSEDLSALVGDIYDAALDPARWGYALGKTRDFVGGHAASLIAKTTTCKSGVVYYQDGRIEEHYVRQYFEKYVKLDPATVAQFFAEVGEPISTLDLFSCEEWLEARIFKEWSRPQGLGDFASVGLDKSPTTAALFGVFRQIKHGPVDDEMRRRLRLVGPHLRRAVLVGRAINLQTAFASAFADAMDGLSAAMLLVAAGGTIVHCNTSGHAMLACGDVLRAIDGRLAARNGDADQDLQQALAAAAKGDAALGTRGIALALAADPGGDRYVGHVMPLTSGVRRRTGAGHAATAALFVHKATLEAPSPPEVIAGAFKLTAGELRVLLAVVQVGGIPETSEALGISENTVKTHLRRLFDKTATSRQADLVKLVAGFQTPLGPQC